MALRVFAHFPPWEWPDDAGLHIQSALTDSSAPEDDRLLAAELAGEFVVTSDEMTASLLIIVNNPDEGEALRSAAVIALGTGLEYADMMGFEDPQDIVISEEVFQRVQAILKDLYDDTDLPEGFRRRVLETSARAPQEWHIDAVREAYNCGDSDWRLSAVFSMRFVCGFESQIIEALETAEDPDIFYEALCAAGLWGLDAAWHHVYPLAVSEETEKALRIAAIYSMAAIRPKEAVGLLGTMTAHEDEDIADAAYEALIETGEFLESEEFDPDEEDEDSDDEDDLLH